MTKVVESAQTQPDLPNKEENDLQEQDQNVSQESEKENEMEQKTRKGENRRDNQQEAVASIYQCHLCLLLLSSQTEVIRHFADHYREQKGAHAEQLQVLNENNLDDTSVKVATGSVHVRKKKQGRNCEELCQTIITSSDRTDGDEHRQTSDRSKDEKENAGSEDAVKNELCEADDDQNEGDDGRPSTEVHTTNQDLDARYKCDGKKKAWGLKRHELYHKGQNLHTCNICGKSLNSQRALVKHQASHSGAKSYKCKVCDQDFAKPEEVAAHTKENHPGNKPFVCSICGYAFSVKYKLTSHMMSHTGERPFVCAACGKGFTKKRNLQTHEKLHTEEGKSFKCGQCDRGYLSQNSLKQVIVLLAFCFRNRI